MLLGNFYKKTEAAAGCHRRVSRRARARQRASERALQPGAGLQGRGPLRRSARRLRARARARSEEWEGALAARRPLDAQGRFARAEAIVTDALERKVDEHRLLLKLGESRIEAKRFDEAERALRRCAREETGAGARALRPRPRLRREGADRQGDRTPTRRSSRRTRRRTARRSTPRSCCRKAAAPERRSRISARSSRSNRRSAPASSISPRRCWTPAISAAPSSGRAPVCTNKPEPRMAPLGHYVLADVYERQGRAADARREVEAARRLEHPGL